MKNPPKSLATLVDVNGDSGRGKPNMDPNCTCTDSFSYNDFRDSFLVGVYEFQMLDF